MINDRGTLKAGSSDMKNKRSKSKSIVFVMGGITSGGAERVASRLMHYWTDKGWDITLIVGNKPEDDFYELPKSIKRIVINTGSPSSNKVVGLMKNAPYVWRLRKALKHLDSPNILSFLTRTNIHTILACMGLNKRVIISERNDTTREDHLWPWPLLRRILYRFADVVTANSEVALEGMKEYVAADKLKFVPNPVTMPEDAAYPAEFKSILNVGRMVYQKAQYLLIEALSLIGKDKLNGWKLNILGIGEEEENLKKLTAEKGLSDRVIFHGWVSDIPKMYQKAGIFVLTSRYEGTPNAMLEAMSYGLPCIISNTLPGAMELIEDDKSGLVFLSGDVEDLAEKMFLLMENPELRTRLGENARERIRPHAFDNVIPIWESLIV